MCGLRSASCRFLAPTFCKAPPCSVKNDSTRWKHLWRRGRKATVSRVDISQRTNSQSSSKSLSSTVSKCTSRAKKFCACFHSTLLFAWLLMTTSLKFSFCKSRMSFANFAKNSCKRRNACAHERRARSWASALIWQSWASHTEITSLCSGVKLSKYRSKKTRAKVAVGNCNMCGLRSASCRFLAPTFCKAPPCSVKNDSTRWKHLWRRGRKATVSRVDISQRTNSQSSSKSLSSTVSKCTSRAKKFCACFHSTLLFAWFLITTSLNVSFCSWTILSANLEKKTCSRANASAQVRRARCWASAPIWQNRASHTAILSFCSAVQLSKYRSKKTWAKLDIGHCDLSWLFNASCKFRAPTFCKASPCSVTNDSTRWKHLWRRGRKATVSRVDISQSTNSQSSNKFCCSTVNVCLLRSQKFCAAFHSLTCFARLLFSTASKVGFCNRTSSST